MLSRADSLALLERYGGNEPWTRHCVAVARAADVLGRALDLDETRCECLWSLALLHDIGRHATHDPIMHGVEGYRLMARLGHHDAAFVCASHVGFGLDAEEAVRFGLPESDFIPHTLGQKIVALVDLLVDGERLTSLEDRIASLRERNAGNDAFTPLIDRAYARASAFKLEMDDSAGVDVVRILRAS